MEEKKSQIAKKQGWGAGIGVFAVLLIFFGSQFAAGVLIYYYAFFRHMNETQAQNWLSDNSYAQFFALALSSILVILLVLGFIKWRGYKPASIGLKKPKIEHIFYGIVLAPAYYVVLLIVLAVSSSVFPSLNVDQKQEIGFDNVSGSLELFLVFLGLAIIVPIAEEILARGLLYSSLKKALPVFWAAIATSLIFAAAHLPEGGDSGPLYVAGIDTFILSMALVYLREKTGNLWAGIVLHSLKNSVAFLFIFILKFN